MKPVGRDDIITRLSPLPICSLIRASASTGKRTVAEYLADQAGVLSIDRRMIPAPYWKDETFIEPELSVEMVRDMIVWARTAPRSAAGKVAIIRLDHARVDGTSWRASPRCVAALLKTLEEPPAGVRFILLASGPVASTIVSRSVGVWAGLLSAEDVAAILYEISDLDLAGAGVVAALGHGRVGPALAASTGAVGSVEAVLGVLGDVACADVDAAFSRGREWTHAHTLLLVRAAHERVTGKFSAFSEEDLSSLSLSQAMAVLSVVRRVEGARPRLILGAVVAALSG
jgi:DNA polymerase III, delta subunit